MQRRLRRGGVVFAFAVSAVLGVVSCRSDRAAPMAEAADASVSASAIAESAAARDRVEELRARFLLEAPHPHGDLVGAHGTATRSLGPHPVLGPAVATGFDVRADGVHPAIPAVATRGALPSTTRRGSRSRSRCAGRATCRSRPRRGATIAGAISSSLCNGSAFESVAQQLRQAAESLVDGTQDPNRDCDGISFGIGFDARLTTLGPVVDLPVTPDVCAPDSGALDAATDASDAGETDG
jgi:hypothetical protein